MRLNHYRAVVGITFVATLILFSIATYLNIIGDRESMAVFAVAGFALFSVIMILRWVIFKCPKCKSYLGKGFKHHCTNCGHEINGEDELG